MGVLQGTQGQAEARPPSKSHGTAEDFLHHVSKVRNAEEPGVSINGRPPASLDPPFEGDEGITVEDSQEHGPPGDPQGFGKGGYGVLYEFQGGDEGHHIESIVVERKVFGAAFMEVNVPGQLASSDLEHIRGGIDPGYPVSLLGKPFGEDPGAAPDFEDPLGTRRGPQAGEEFLLDGKGRPPRLRPEPVAIAQGIFITEGVTHRSPPSQ